MSHYFRSAAQCDPTTAVISPVPLYNDEEGASPVTTKTAQVSVVDVLGGDAADGCRSCSTGGTELDRTRAVVEKPVVEVIRRDIKRQANVLSKLADREEKMRLRAIQEKILTDRVLEQLGRGGREADRLADDDGAADAQKAMGTESVAATSNVSADQQGVEALDERAKKVKKSQADTTAIDIPLFELIKMEEERQLRKSELLGKPTSGSIAALYNTLTYESLRLEHPDLPPSELVRLYNETFIPASATELVGKPRTSPSAQSPDGEVAGSSLCYGHEAQRRALDASLSRRAKLQARHHAILQQEAARKKVVEQARQKRDLESRTVLREVIEHDQAHRQFQEEQRLFRLAQYHEHSLLGSFAPDAAAAGLSTDPLLPPMPENVKEALQLAKRPVHPIDAYQTAVRREILKLE